MLEGWSTAGRNMKKPVPVGNRFVVSISNSNAELHEEGTQNYRI